MSDYPMLISNKLHSFRNFIPQIYAFLRKKSVCIFFFIVNMLLSDCLYHFFCTFDDCLSLPDHLFREGLTSSLLFQIF